MTLYECHCVIVTLFAKSIALRGWLEGLVLLGLRGVLRAIALLLHFWRILLRYYYTFLEGRNVRGKWRPQRRFCVETRRAPSLPLVAPPLGFPRYRAKGVANARPGERRTERAGPEGQTFHGHETPLRSDGWRSAFPRKRQGAKRRAAVAVSGEAAERPMEPEAVRAHPRVFAVQEASVERSLGLLGTAAEEGDEDDRA